MASIDRKLFVMVFSRTFVNAVDYIIHPHLCKTPQFTELFDELLTDLRIFLDRYKMELYFVFAEELVRFSMAVSETNIQELFESMMNDLKKDKYDPQVFSWYCIVLSYYATIAKQRGADSALKFAAKIILDTILDIEKDDKIKYDVVEDIKKSLKETAQLIGTQKVSDNSKK